eukprot:1196100-Prorocentrum_minimum.AAC.5
MSASRFGDTWGPVWTGSSVPDDRRAEHACEQRSATKKKRRERSSQKYLHAVRFTLLVYGPEEQNGGSPNHEARWNGFAHNRMYIQQLTLESPPASNSAYSP